MMKRTKLVAAVQAAGLLCAVLAVAACGGGGGEPSAPTPTASAGPAPSAKWSVSRCLAAPLGVQHHYLNNARPKREWIETSFLGEPAIARRDHDAQGVLGHILYLREDAAAKTITTLGREWFDASGALVRRIRYSGHVRSTDLAVGQTDTVRYTWQVLSPSDVAGGAETLVSTYAGRQALHLPQGRIEACQLKNKLINEQGVQTAEDTEHHAPGLGLVKSYHAFTDPATAEYGQTAMMELLTTSATGTAQAALVSPNADGAPSLAQCSSLPAGLNIRLTATNYSEASTALRKTAADTTLNTSSIALTRRHIATQALHSVFHHDPNAGFLAVLAVAQAKAAGVTRYSGLPDLRATPLGASVDYTVTYTPELNGAASGAVSTSTDRFSFLGHEKITTPAGTFDACKVSTTYQGGAKETYWLVPGKAWVRYESVSAGGARSSREAISH